MYRRFSVTCWWGQQIPLHSHCTSIRLHRLTSLNIAFIILTAGRTLNLSVVTLLFVSCPLRGKQRQSVHLHNSIYNCAYTFLVTSQNTVNSRMWLKVLAKAYLLIYSVINCGRPLGQNNFSTEGKDRQLLFLIRRKLLSQHGFEAIRDWVFKN